MGDDFGMEFDAMGRGDRDWAQLAVLMRDTQSDLAAASASGLAPSIRSAAEAFLTAWAGYAGESAAIGDGFSGALRALIGDVTTTEEVRESDFRDLDARLGPAR